MFYGMGRDNNGLLITLLVHPCTTLRFRLQRFGYSTELYRKQVDCIVSDCVSGYLGEGLQEQSFAKNVLFIWFESVLKLHWINLLVCAFSHVFWTLSNSLEDKSPTSFWSINNFVFLENKLCFCSIKFIFKYQCMKSSWKSSNYF